MCRKPCFRAIQILKFAYDNNNRPYTTTRPPEKRMRAASSPHALSSLPPRPHPAGKHGSFYLCGPAESGPSTLERFHLSELKRGRGSHRSPRSNISLSTLLSFYQRNRTPHKVKKQKEVIQTKLTYQLDGWCFYLSV